MPGNIPGNGVTPMLLGSFTPGAGQGTLDCDLDAGAASTVCYNVLSLVHNMTLTRACVVFVASVVLGNTQLDQGSI